MKKLLVCLVLSILSGAGNAWAGSGPPGAILLPHGSAVTSCAIAPDGKRLVTGCGDRTVRLWDVASGKEIARMQGHTGAITDLAFSPDGKSFVSIAGKDGNVRMWESGTGRLLWMLGSDHQINAVAVSADGTKVAAAGDLRRVLVTEAATGRMLRTHEAHTDAILAVAISADSKLVATGGKDRLLNVWQMATGHQLYRKAGPDEISVLAFSPDGKLLAMSGTDKVIRLFDVEALREVRQLAGHQDRVRALAFLPDGKTLLSGSRDRTIRVWEVASGKEIRTAKPHTGGITALALSADARLMASSSEDGSALVCSLASLPDGNPKPIDLTAQQLEGLWADLAREDSRAIQAVWDMVAGGKHAVPFLKEHLKETAPVEDARVAQLIKELDSDDFTVREKASQDLEQLGKTVEEALTREMRQTSSSEVRRRIKLLLEKLGPGAPRSPEQMRAARAVDVLEQVGTPEARQLLQQLARGQSTADLTQLARAALERLAKQAEKP
jgi:hypothetical protein